MAEKVVRCARCKRKLTGKAAKYWGMGSTCMKKAPGLAARIRAEAQGQMPLWDPAVPGSEKTVAATWEDGGLKKLRLVK